MTEHEAIMDLQEYIGGGEYNGTNPPIYLNTAILAINALEKQIAKKPKMRHVKPYDKYNDGWCPCCGGYVQEEEYDTFHCQRCGQKLDWSEV